MKYDLILDDLLSIPKALLNCLKYYLSDDVIDFFNRFHLKEKSLGIGIILHII